MCKHCLGTTIAAAGTKRKVQWDPALGGTNDDEAGPSNEGAGPGSGVDPSGGASPSSAGEPDVAGDAALAAQLAAIGSDDEVRRP